MCYIMVFGLPTVFMSNIRSSFLLWSTYHFLPGMIQKEVLRKLLRGMCISSSICSYISQAERMEIMLFSYKVCLLCNYLFKNRILSRSQELKVGKYDKLSDVLEQHRLQILQKSIVIQWLCFTPPSTITDVSTKLVLRALIHR